MTKYYIDNNGFLTAKIPLEIDSPPALSGRKYASNKPLKKCPVCGRQVGRLARHIRKSHIGYIAPTESDAIQESTDVIKKSGSATKMSSRGTNMTTLLSEINRVREDIRKGRLNNEAAVTQGSILPILAALNWPIFDTSVVSPQPSIEGKHGDLALRDTRGRTSVLIEAKAIGKTEGADRQLFEYAFHQGIPFLVLTDGQEWSLYLPSEQGTYQERRLNKIDLLERDPEESARLLERYLSYDIAHKLSTLTTCQGGI